jgi:hypothetical protein
VESTETYEKVRGQRNSYRVCEAEMDVVKPNSKESASFYLPVFPRAKSGKNKKKKGKTIQENKLWNLINIL